MNHGEDAGQSAYQLRRSQQLGWALGSMGTGVMLGMLTSYGVFYMVNYAGIAAALAGSLIGASKFYDLVVAPVIGRLSDRTETRWGRRRPFLLAASIACPLALLALFNLPAFDRPEASLAALVAVLVFFATAFSAFNVPYFAMPAEMTTSYRERTLIMSWRVFFSTMAVVAVAIGGPFIIRAFGSGVAGYQGFSAAMALVVFLAMGGTFLLTRGVAFTARHTGVDDSLRRQVRLILDNRPFCVFIGAKSLMFIGSASLQGTLLFMGQFVLGRGEMIMAGFGAGYTAGVVLSLPVWNRLISRGFMDKRGAFRVSAIGLGLTMLTWWLAHPAEPAALFYGRFVLLGVFSAGSLVSGSAMLPDIMEYDRRRSGVAQEGLYAATFSIIEKIAYVVGPALLGLLLGAAGFISVSKGQFVEQPDSAITAIRIAVAIIPGVLSIAGGLLIGLYDLDERKLKSVAVAGEFPGGADGIPGR